VRTLYMYTCVLQAPIDHTAEQRQNHILPQNLTSAVQFLTCAQKSKSQEAASDSAAPQCGLALSAVLGFEEVGGWFISIRGGGLVYS